MRQYLFKECNAQHFEVLVDGVRVQGETKEKPGLRTEWTSDENAELRSIPLFMENGNYRGQTAFAYERNRTLWIACKSGRLLNDSEAEYIDLWSDANGLPEYIPSSIGAARTSILLPLSYGRRVFGVAVIEFGEKLPCTEAKKAELKLIFAAVARIIWLNHTTNNQLEDTKHVLHELEKKFGREGSIFDPPSLFFAASDRADEEVVELIRDVLKKRTSGRLKLMAWDQMSNSGPINDEIVEEISKAKIGVCYLSEKNGDEGVYADNRNVLFEAGMFEALSREKDVPVRGWIPVREDAGVTDEPPFDIAGHRMVLVPRKKNSSVDAEAFKKKLLNQLDNLINDVLGVG